MTFKASRDSSFSKKEMTPIHGNNMTGTSSTASSSVAMNQVERVNGWTCPWHPLQFIAWFFLIFFAVVYYGTFVPHLSLEWRPAGYIIPGGVYIIHVIFHVFALSIDPADPNIQSCPKRDKIMFDRSVHRHVIENSHCYICQADVGTRSKHCSVCNKCVSEFDHHCKWLNNCVGGRNYKLFIGCVTSAFFEALLVFVVTLYLIVAYFTDLVVLKNNAGGQLKLFVPVSDMVFIIFLVVVAVLLLLALALLGHLLGFHIYLMCHKMSTYDFIVHQREYKAAQHDDLESGRAKFTPKIKLKNNKVTPVIEITDEQDGRVEVSEGVQSESSVEMPSKETAVKIISEVSSKAAKNYRSYAGTEQESPECKEKTTKKPQSAVIDINSPRPSSSEESLKEIPYHSTSPQVVIMPRSDGSQPSTTSQSPLHSREIRKHRDIAQTVEQRAESQAVSENEPVEESNTPRRKKKKPLQVEIDILNENSEIGPSENIHNVAGPSNVEGVKKKKKKKRTVPLDDEQGEDTERLTPRKKKKRKPKVPEGEGELPPLVMKGRPLPTLPSGLQHEESPC